MTELKIGWKEWVSLPDLQIPAIKAKVDAGARTSVLHASHITTFTNASGSWVRYVVRPLRNKPEIEIQCESKLLDRRDIKNPGGARLNHVMSSKQPLCWVKQGGRRHYR